MSRSPTLYPDGHAKAAGIRLDKLDNEIISALTVDGRRSFADIARQFAVSEGAIRARVNRLVGERVIRITVIPGEGRISANVVVGLKVSDDLEAILNKLSGFSEISKLVVCSGRYDVLTWITCTDAERLTRLLVNIRRIQGVRIADIMQLYDRRLKCR